jgi:hypothetical protein
MTAAKAFAVLLVINRLLLSFRDGSNSIDGALGEGLAGKLRDTRERVYSFPAAPVSLSILTVYVPPSESPCNTCANTISPVIANGASGLLRYALVGVPYTGCMPLSKIDVTNSLRLSRHETAPAVPAENYVRYPSSS